MRKRLCLLACLVFCANADAKSPAAAPKKPAPAAAKTAPLSPLDLSLKAYQDKDYPKALELARPLAASGDATAMTLLGELYLQGFGTAKNVNLAAKWYERAANKNEKFANFAFATMLYEGEGVKRDINRAQLYFLKAAELGHPGAQYNMGLSQLQTDPLKAAQWFEKSAAQENGDAAYALAQLLNEGKGVGKDDVKSVGYLKLGAENGSRDAMTEYAIHLFNGTGTAKDEKQAAIWFEKAAQLGSPIAQNRLAKLYWKGRGVEADKVRASAWHMKARAQGLNDADLDGVLFSLKPDEKAQADTLAQPN